MKTYNIHITENNETETATFTMEENENLYEVVQEVLEGLGFKPYFATNLQKIRFYCDSITLWEDTLNNSIALWTLESDMESNTFKLYTIC